MVVTIRDRVKKLAAAGKSLAEVQAAKPTAEFDKPGATPSSSPLSSSRPSTRTSPGSGN